MKYLELLLKRGDILVALSIIALLGVMLVPLPTFILDLFLSVSIALGVVILVISVYLKRPLDFSVFPSLLLMTTLFRLSLNIASTKLILLHGSDGPDAAGHVIQSFGNFVVGGNYVVGFIVFLILVVVNFVVITKGAGRIAEVAARFTLDAMPGKQMAIDADLNAGMIDETEARRRRQDVSREADFYGAMDGSSKFVRGDAIAGIAITGINIVGGFIIGVFQMGMPMVEAAKTYTILTVGEGLVAQIPALLISTAAGIVVTRTGSSNDMGKDIAAQVIVNPKALGTSSAILLVVGLIPGLPHLPLLAMAATLGGLAYVLHKPDVPEPDEAVAATKKEEPRAESLLEVNTLALEIGYGLISLVDETGGELLQKVRAMRRQIAKEMGFIVPSIHIKDNLALRPHEYSFNIRGIEVARGEVMMGYWLAVSSDGAAAIEGTPTREPAFGLPASWIEEKDVEKAQLAGHMVVDPATVIVTHLTEIIRKHSWEILTRTEVQSLLEGVAKVYPRIVDELIPTHMTLGAVQRVLQNLLRERVPVNDLVTILETLLDYAPTTKDVDILTEYVRQALCRYITRQFTAPDGVIRVISLDPRFETALTQAMGGEPMSPAVVSRLVHGVETSLEGVRGKGAQPVILCSIQVRRFLRRLLEKFAPAIPVLSSAEVSSTAHISTVGMVKYEN
ncbi:MAG: flagellar biosynthesis protein FlhA [Deltaproteobacteria bacterium CG2_30_66_27]|nr:MAG: flagellar biosynthesis protein FlhA [Deltaproteobacteria bacterium CG2_30_66_27]